MDIRFRSPEAPATPARPDAELLEEYRASRSETAFTEIVARHGPMVYRTCLGVLARAEESEDAAQATFLVLARRPGAAERALAGWLHGTALRTSWALVRSRAHRARREVEAAKRMKTHSPEGAGELRAELDQALLRLPSPLREAVALRYLGGRSQEEAAHAAGCPQGTLGWRAMEGLNRLRAILGRRGVAVSTVALLGFLGQQASAVVPASSLAAMAACGTGAVASTGPAALLADAAVRAVFWAKAKVCAAVLAAATAAASAVPLAARLSAPAEPPPPIPPLVLRASLSASPGEVSSSALAPDARRVALGGAEGVITVLDLEMRRERIALRRHRGPVQALAYSAAGAMLASGGEDGRVVLWDPATGTRLREISDPSAIRSVALSPDGLLVAAGLCHEKEGVKVWEAATGRPRPGFRGHADIVHAVAFSPDGKLLASGGRDRSVRLWDAATGNERLSIRLDTSHVVCLAFSPDGRTLATAGGAGGSDEGLRLWDAATGRERAALSGRVQLVHRAAFAPDGGTLAWVGDDGHIRLWDLAASRETARIEVHARGRDLFSGLAVAFSRDGRTLVSTGADGTVKIWTPAGSR